MLSHNRIDEVNLNDMMPARLGNQPILDNRYILLNTIGQGRYAEQVVYSIAKLIAIQTVFYKRSAFLISIRLQFSSHINRNFLNSIFYRLNSLLGIVLNSSFYIIYLCFRVKVALDTRNHLRKVAIKLIKPEQTNTITKLNITRQQVLLLSDCQYCQNIIQLLASNADGVIRNSAGDCVIRENVIYLVTRYAQYGQLFRLLQSGSRFSEPYSRLIFKQILNGVSFLHDKHQICHRDIKMQNLLVDKFGVVKIADFGWAARLEGEYRSCSGDSSSSNSTTTISSSCTEQKQEQQKKVSQDYDRKQFGEFQVSFPVGTQEQVFIIYTMLLSCCKHMKKETDDMMERKLTYLPLEFVYLCFYMRVHLLCKQVYVILIIKSFQTKTKKVIGEFIEGFRHLPNLKVEQLSDLVQKMLSPQPHKRLTLKEIFKHPWLQQGETVDYQELRQQISNRIAQIQKRNDVNKHSSTQTTNQSPALIPSTSCQQNIALSGKQLEQLKMMRNRMIQQSRANNCRLRQLRKEMKSRDLSSSSSIFGNNPQYEYQSSNSSGGGSVQNTTPPNQQSSERFRKELQDPAIQTTKQLSNNQNKEPLPDSLTQTIQDNSVLNEQITEIYNQTRFDQDAINKRSSDNESNKSQQDQLNQKSINKNTNINDQFNIGINLIRDMMPYHRQSVSDSQRYNQQLEVAMKYYDQQKKDNNSLMTKQQIPLTLKRSISRAYGQR